MVHADVPRMEVASRIHVLPDLLVRKIAAGEIVERPASVVKELIENAIDSGASRIALAVEEGGRRLIRVTDDGCGMNAQELRLAVLPHATSKISTEDDLYRIGTMGFRGEALASISAVSKLRIASRTAGSIEGHEICVAGEGTKTAQPAGCNIGTTVEVRDLFFNVPARRKYLRTPSTEVGHIHEQVTRVALAHAQVAFDVTHNGRVTQKLPRCETRLERIAKIYGPELASDLMHVARNERGIALDGYLAPPARARATTQWQYLFVNGRYIRDRFLQHAIKEAYRGLMEPNRHAVTFLFIDLDPREVDVNVHPTKIEVRWADANLIHSQVLSALRETFQQCDLSPALRTDRAREPVNPAEQDRLRREFADVLQATAPIRPGAPGASTGYHSPGPMDAGFSSRAATASALDPGHVWRSLYGSADRSRTDPMKGEGKDSLCLNEGDATESEAQARGFETGADGLPHDSAPRPRAIQMHNLYLVAETDDGIVIIDQHALHERVMYEQFRRRMTTGPLESQRLLLPETIRVTPGQSALLETHADLLEKLGIEVSPFGTDSVAVHAFPARMKDTDVVSFLHDLLDRLADRSGGTEPDEVLNDILSMMACKAAVKAGDPMTPEEIESLMQQRHLLDTPSSCPHGRPTTLRLTKADLNRQFHR
ncbi:MAG: DNA mismatch repair endonuclease MutL [Planctomycetes bacterium]|nr:DNA mismatch repair endonuclease MutL [Planctomycetota bacterium]